MSRCPPSRPPPAAPSPCGCSATPKNTGPSSPGSRSPAAPASPTSPASCPAASRSRCSASATAAPPIPSASPSTPPSANATKTPSCSPATPPEPRRKHSTPPAPFTSPASGTNPTPNPQRTYGANHLGCLATGPSRSACDHKPPCKRLRHRLCRHFCDARGRGRASSWSESPQVNRFGICRSVPLRGSAQLVLDGQADPGGERTVNSVRRPPRLLQQFRREPDRHRGAQPGTVPAACGSLRFLVLGPRVEGVFLVRCHRRVHLLSFLYWAASACEVSYQPVGRHRRGSLLRAGASGTISTRPPTSAHISQCA